VALAGSPVKPLFPDVAAAVSGIGTAGQVAFWADSSGSLAGFGQWDSSHFNLALGDSSNVVSGDASTVGGGQSNSARGIYSTVGGGGSNTASGYATTIGGGNSNQAFLTESTVGGGGFNVASGQDATVGGGNTNMASGSGATIGGGDGNMAAGAGATVGGGDSNNASGLYATIGGGLSGSATGAAATVGGGFSNTAQDIFATVAGGSSNRASDYSTTVGGGYANWAAKSYATVGGGEYSFAGGLYSTVPGGFLNEAFGDGSFAAGTLATVHSGHHGTILFSDDTYASTSGSSPPFYSVAPDEFAVRATGGFRFVTGIDMGGNVRDLVSINASGSLGVHTGSPSYTVDVRTSGSSSSQMHIAPTGIDVGGYLTSANAGNLFMSAGAAWNGSAWVAKSSTSYQYGGGVAGVRFFFDTGLTVGGTYTPTTRMFIGPTGNVGIGMSTQPAHLLQLGSDDAAKPSTNTWTIASDGRLKDPESIEPFTEGSDLIKRLPQPVWFRYRKELGLPDDRRVAGWIAQDIAPVAPFMIRRTRQKLAEDDTEATETLSLNTNELPYAMLNSIKELLAAVEEIRDQIRELRNETTN
jgi:hypothetical protein